MSAILGCHISWPNPEARNNSDHQKLVDIPPTIWIPKYQLSSCALITYLPHHSRADHHFLSGIPHKMMTTNLWQVLLPPRPPGPHIKKCWPLILDREKYCHICQIWINNHKLRQPSHTKRNGHLCEVTQANVIVIPRNQKRLVKSWP